MFANICVMLEGEPDRPWLESQLLFSPVESPRCNTISHFKIQHIADSETGTLRKLMVMGKEHLKQDTKSTGLSGQSSVANRYFSKKIHPSKDMNTHSF